jgi:flagellar protein FlaG
MEVTANPELKSHGLPAAPAIERDLRQKAETRALEQKSDAARAALDQKMNEQKERVSGEQIARAVSEVQERLDALGTTLNFTLDEKTEDIVIHIKNKQSGELVRQIPSEEMLVLKSKLENLMGILFDQKV